MESEKKHDKHLSPVRKNRERERKREREQREKNKKVRKKERTDRKRAAECLNLLMEWKKKKKINIF